LGHLPFQGQDSTQQHLVEIMKLLGTPTDADLQAMNAPCVAEDLPKLKPFPWDRIFSAGTPPEAIDLAQRLLRYDPKLRLDAVAILAHPFFDRAAGIVSGAIPVEPASTPGRGGSQPTTAAEWEQRMNRYYSDIMGREDGVDDAVRAIVQKIEYAASKTKEPSALAAEAVEAMQQELSTGFKGAPGKENTGGGEGKTRGR
jgi:glycogen synthase kinase 3 beta